MSSIFSTDILTNFMQMSLEQKRLYVLREKDNLKKGLLVTAFEVVQAVGRTVEANLKYLNI